MQKLDLNRQRDISDFVQKNRSAVSLLKEPFLSLAPRARKGSSDIPEQLALEKRRRNCITVHLHKRSFRHSHPVNRTGKNRLPSSALSCNQCIKPVLGSFIGKIFCLLCLGTVADKASHRLIRHMKILTPGFLVSDMF